MTAQTATAIPTPAEVRALEDAAMKIYHHHLQVWADYRALPQEEQERQNLLWRQLNDRLSDEYTRAWALYAAAQAILDKEAALKRNKARAEAVRSKTCMSCFEVRAANGTCGC
ncbi:hypothetical protein [Streptomyces sp. NBC_00425]|uniref:hypothetical protein n=1 Tax=Streptomyces sp. NBC_00425 TaxID=2975740 RepID=UPI002E242B2F